MIEGVGHVTSLVDVTMTCANICGGQLAILDVTVLNPILYQLAWKIIKFIKKKKKHGCAIIRMRLCIFQWFSWGRSINSSSYMFQSPRIPSAQTRWNWEIPTWKPSRLQVWVSLSKVHLQNVLSHLKKILSPRTSLHLQRVFSPNLPWMFLSTNLTPTTPPNKVPTRSAPLPPKVEGATSQVQRNTRRNFPTGA